MMKVDFEGGRELEEELSKLASHTTRRASARRALLKAAMPMVPVAKAKAPRDKGHLEESIKVGTRVSGPNAARAAYGEVLAAGGTRSQAVQALRDVQRESASFVSVSMGPGRHPQAITQEFGTYKHAPQPFMRPTWDAEKGKLIPAIRKELWDDIKKSLERAERRAARLATKGQK